MLLRGAESGGRFGAFVFHHAAIAENPPHVHQDFAKILYILDGQYEFRVGDAAFSGGPGSLVLVPQGSQHAFTTAAGCCSCAHRRATRRCSWKSALLARSRPPSS